MEKEIENNIQSFTDLYNRCDPKHKTILIQKYETLFIKLQFESAGIELDSNGLPVINLLFK